MCIILKKIIKSGSFKCWMRDACDTFVLFDILFDIYTVLQPIDSYSVYLKKAPLL